MTCILLSGKDLFCRATSSVNHNLFIVQRLIPAEKTVYEREIPDNSVKLKITTFFRRLFEVFLSPVHIINSVKK